LPLTRQQGKRFGSASRGGVPTTLPILPPLPPRSTELAS
jgi:hypothetical protein